MTIPKPICEKLIRVQSKLGSVLKDSKNPHFKSKYSTIESVLDSLKPVLELVGLGVNQPLVQASMEGFCAIETIIFDEEGNTFSFKSELPVARKSDPQAFGAAITYLRRYALVSFFVMAQEDDDGNFAKDGAIRDLYAVAEEASVKKEDLMKAVFAFKKSSLYELNLDQIAQIKERILNKVAKS